MGYNILMNFSGLVTTTLLNNALCGVLVRGILVNGEIIIENRSNRRGEWALMTDHNFDIITFEKSGYVRKAEVVKLDFPKLIRMLEDSIIGFQDKLWFNPGEKVSAYIHSNSEFDAKLIRHGFKNEEVLKLGSFSESIQDVPNGFFVADGLNWRETIQYQIPSVAESGLYSVVLTQKDGNKYSITFVVQPKLNNINSKKKILVLASTNNWQTYNIWGGRSRYRNFENPKTSQFISNLKTIGLRFAPENIKSITKKIFRKNTIVTINDHSKAFQFRPLSIKRPHPNCSINEEHVMNEFTNHLAPGELRILAWLEREGFKYDLVSGYELHKNQNLMNNYNVVILSTHSEYWSKEMFNGLKEFYNRGGSILNLSGNSIYREVEFLDGGSLRCTSLRFTDSVEDESQIIGVRFDMRGYGECAPFKVVNSNHWAFEGTTLKNGDTFAEKSLNHFLSKIDKNFNADPASSPGMASLKGNGGSGWETDKVTTTAPNDIELLARGTNRRRGGADMIIREPDGKGIMFSVSSITFGGSLLIDEKCSRIVKNVINRSYSKN